MQSEHEVRLRTHTFFSVRVFVYRLLLYLTFLEGPARAGEASLDLGMIKLSLVAGAHGGSLFAGAHALESNGLIGPVRVAPLDFRQEVGKLDTFRWES